MIPRMVITGTFESLSEMDDFFNSLGVPCQPEEPKKEYKSKALAYLEKLYGFLDATGAEDSHQEPKQETTPAKQPLTGGKVNYYTAKVDPLNKPAYTAECGDIIDALGMTFNEANIVKEIWRTANARLGNGKPGNTALRGAEKIAYYANRIYEAEKQKA